MDTQPTLEPNGNRNCVINRRCELTIILSRPYYFTYICSLLLRGILVLKPKQTEPL